jgi:Flp pilus assembly protein TadD
MSGCVATPPVERAPSSLAREAGVSANFQEVDVPPSWTLQGDTYLYNLHLQFALDVRPHTAYFWTNLGTLYRRGGKLEEAEAAFLVAEDIDNDPTAMSNLSRLYQQLREPQLAQYYAQKDYAQTEKLLGKAIRYRKDEHEFHRQRGLSYLQHGERVKAQHRFKQAAELVDELAQRERYNHKLHLLADG